MILNSPTISGSLTVTGNIITSGSITLSGSVASASYAQNATTAQTSSYANAFTVAGTLTAQTLVVQTITSSVDFVTGSTRFGSISGNTHQFTGSVGISGSLSGIGATFSGNVRINAPTNGTNKLIFGIAATDYYWLEYNDATGNIGYSSKYNHIFYGGLAGTSQILSLANNGAATFASSVTANSGTTGAAISLNATTNYGLISDANGFNRIWFENVGSYRTLFDLPASGTSFDFRTSAGVILTRITSGGNVGIGTSSPTATLHTEVNSSTWTAKIINTNTSTNNAGLLIKAGVNSGNEILLVQKANGASLFLVDAGGNIGMGTTTPVSQLELSSGSPKITLTATNYAGSYRTILGARSGAEGVLQLGNNNDNFIVGGNTGAGGNLRFYVNATSDFVTSTNGTLAMTITSGGVVQIGGTNAAPWNITSGTVSQVSLNTTWPLVIAGNDIISIFNRVGTNGTMMEFKYNSNVVGTISTNSNSLPSDLNFKKDITDISIGLNLVSKLRPVHYRHKMDNDDEALSNGIIAQELEQSLLECGIEKNSLLMLQHKPNEKETESQYWVDYTKMIPVLVKAIQELKAEIDTLKNNQ
jgi:hypothetical protein